MMSRPLLLATACLLLGTGIGFLIGKIGSPLDKVGKEAASAGRYSATPEGGSSGGRAEFGNTKGGPRSATQSVEGELEDFRRILTSGATYDAKFEFYQKLREMTPEAAPKMIRLIAELGAEGHDLDTVSKLFWQRWGEIDGEAACNAIFDIDKRFNETEFSKRAIESWARMDPAAASAWLFSQNDVPLRDGMIKGLLRGMVEADPEMAQRFLANPDLLPEHRELGYQRLARHWLREGGVEGLRTWYDRFPPDDPMIHTVSTMTADVFAGGRVEDALAWVAGLDETSEQTAYVRDRVYQRLAQFKPDGLVTYLGHVEGAADLAGADALASQAVAGWARSNPGAMANWLINHNNLRNYDLVAVPFVRSVADRDPEAAAAWAETVKDAEARAALLAQLNGE